MKNYYSKITIQVFLLFITVILASFIPETFPSFFGDQWCVYGRTNGYQQGTACIIDLNIHHAKQWHWGSRHWLWCLMSLTLFVIQVVRIFETKKEPEK